MLTIYNTLTKKKQPFKPLVPNQVSLYVCGVTVYDACHIGHARTYVAFDVICRYFRMKDYAVKYVRNITDIDDKIIKRANEKKISADALAKAQTQGMHDDFSALNILMPDHEPKATDSMAEIIMMITTLIDKGVAYATDKGDVYYRVKQCSGYGQLSGQNIAQLQEGARVAVDEDKEDPLDFALWKAAKPGEPIWSSPWGEGRPGWHIECSAMAKSAFGATFDIHGGGSDLTFPHHENEIAQSVVANDKPFAHLWMHTGMVRVNAEKMAKSLGNFFLIRDVLKDYDAEVIRYFLISGHYRSSIHYSDLQLQSATAGLTRLYTALRGLTPSAAPKQSPYIDRFTKAMDDDFNTPEALAVLFELVRDINRAKKTDMLHANTLASVLLHLANVLGILAQPVEEYFNVATTNNVDIDALILQRAKEKKAGNYAKADQIRDTLLENGIVIEDGPEGTRWRKK